MMNPNIIMNKCMRQIGDKKLCKTIVNIVKDEMITYRNNIDRAVMFLNVDSLDLYIGKGKKDGQLYTVLVDGRFVLALRLDEDYNVTASSIATPMVAAMLDLHVDVSSSIDAVTGLIFELAMRQLGLAPAP